MPLYIDDLSTTFRMFEKLAGDTAKLSEAVLYAGAEAMIETWRDVISDEDMTDTGDMLNSVGVTKAPQQKGGVWEVTVAPTGKDRKGVRNAEKAAILNYGSSSINAKSYFGPLETRAQAAATKAAQAVMDTYNATGYLPTADFSALKPKKKKKG